MDSVYFKRYFAIFSVLYELAISENPVQGAGHTLRLDRRQKSGEERSRGCECCGCRASVDTLKQTSLWNFSCEKCVGLFLKFRRAICYIKIYFHFISAESFHSFTDSRHQGTRSWKVPCAASTFLSACISSLISLAFMYQAALLLV